MVLGRYKEKGLWALLFPQAKSMGEIRRENFIFLKFHWLVSQFFFPSRIYGGVLKDPQAMECHSIFIPKRILDSLALKTFWCGKAKISQHWIYLVTGWLTLKNSMPHKTSRLLPCFCMLWQEPPLISFLLKKKSQNLNLVYPVLGLSALFSGHCFRKILLKHSYSAILFVMPWELS